MPSFQQLLDRVSILERDHEIMKDLSASNHSSLEVAQSKLDHTLDKLTFSMNNQNMKQLELNRSFKTKIEENKGSLEVEHERITLCFDHNKKKKRKYDEIEKILVKHDKRNSVFIDTVDSKLANLKYELEEKIELTDTHFTAN